MTLRFNMLLEEAGLDPSEVRLLRHQTTLPDGRIPLDLWQNDPQDFDRYQSFQSHSQRARFTRPWWASFSGTRDGRTLFLGMYEVSDPTLVSEDTSLEATGQSMPAGTYDHYPITPSNLLRPYAGKLYIEWGGGSSGKRSRSQRPEVQEKLVTELRLEEAQPPFPGLMNLAMPLTGIIAAPAGWAEHLSQARGIYLLACPNTGTLYVGSATGSDGFWGRWVTYDADGHGGNMALIEGEKRDWIVSILQVASSADTAEEIVAAESLWKRKLQSRQFGFNRN